MKSPLIYLEIYQYFLIGSFRKADYNVASGTEGISLNFILKLLIYFDNFPTSLKAWMPQNKQMWSDIFLVM